MKYRTPLLIFAMVAFVLNAGLATKSGFGVAAASSLVAIICFAVEDILSAIKRK